MKTRFDFSHNLPNPGTVSVDFFDHDNIIGQTELSHSGAAFLILFDSEACYVQSLPHGLDPPAAHVLETLSRAGLYQVRAGPEDEAAFQAQLQRQGVDNPLDLFRTPYYPQLRRQLEESWKNLFLDPSVLEPAYTGAAL